MSEKSEKNKSDDEADAEQEMPLFVKGESGPHEPALKQGQTRAPRSYDENTLLAAMETAGKQIEVYAVADASRPATMVMRTSPVSRCAATSPCSPSAATRSKLPGAPPQSPRIISPDYKNPFTWQSSIGFQKQINSVTGFEAQQPARHSLYRGAIKRMIDVTAVLATAFITLPLVLLMAFCVSLDGNAPFYAQKRVGKGGRIFTMWKLRSMIPGADAKLEAYLATDPEARAEWDRTQKLKKDPRITRLLPFWQTVFERAKVSERYVIALRNRLARGVIHRARIIEPLLDVRREAGPAERDAHLFRDGQEEILEDFEFNGIDAHYARLRSRRGTSGDAADWGRGTTSTRSSPCDAARRRCPASPARSWTCSWPPTPKSTGAAKANAIERLSRGEDTLELPASALLHHHDTTVVIDRACRAALH